MRASRTAWILAATMATAALGATALRPGSKATARGDGVVLETLVPKAFGSWQELNEPSAMVVNPETQQTLDRIYSQLLARTYVDRDGYRIMLSVAYGDDQRGGLQAHRPEVCYPAQGFEVSRSHDAALPTAFGPIAARRLQTSLGARREPVTYWLTMGDRVVRTQLDRRLAELRLGLTGQIPDGLLFRVSSIDDDPARAFERQQRFAAELVSAVPALARRRLSGLDDGSGG